MLEHEEERKQSLKEGLIELEDGWNIENERKERLMVTKISGLIGQEDSSSCC